MDAKRFHIKSPAERDALQAIIEFYHKYDNPFKTLENRDDEFRRLLNFTDIGHMHQISWDTVTTLKTLHRNQFPGELYWRQHDGCSGFSVSNYTCEFRVSEMQLVSYTPIECTNGTYDKCDTLVAYVRINIKYDARMLALLQFLTTIFTCAILMIGSALFQNDTTNIVIRPITKMVSIIKTLADDPLKKPEPPQIEEEDNSVDAPKKALNEMKTIELQKTIFRIGNLLQMSFGQLGAVIIRENVSSGDGSLEINIPGMR